MVLCHSLRSFFTSLCGRCRRHIDFVFPIDQVVRYGVECVACSINKIAIENSKTGKVRAVVAILKVFGDNTCNSRNTNPGKLLNKPNHRLNLKKKHLNRSLKRPNELHERVRDISERLIVKKRLWVLLDTGSSGDLLFVRKGSQKYIPTLKRAVPQSWGTSNGTFRTKKVGEITLTFFPNIH